MPPRGTCRCYVCEADEPANYVGGSKRTRLLTWQHYHATNGIRHVGLWRADRAAGMPAEGKDRLSRTIGWDIRQEAVLLANTRNAYGDISLQNFDQIWRLEFDQDGGIYHTDDPQVIFDIGMVYQGYVSKVGIRLKQQADAMVQNAGNTLLTQYYALLEQEAVVQNDQDRHLLRSGMALEQAIMADGGYPTWDRPRIWASVLMLPNMEPGRFATTEVHRVLCSLAGC
jgi:hypothetical protein